jgi:hypothetical protein
MVGAGTKYSILRAYFRKKFGVWARVDGSDVGGADILQ